MGHLQGEGRERERVVKGLKWDMLHCIMQHMVAIAGRKEGMGGEGRGGEEGKGREGTEGRGEDESKGRGGEGEAVWFMCAGLSETGTQTVLAKWNKVLQELKEE